MKILSSKWITHAERSNFQHSPRYLESIAYFKQFEKETPFAKMISMGHSPSGRSLECIVAAGKQEFNPAKAKASGKAVVLIQNGIHAGEIEGKDACMQLLRDILISRKYFWLLDNIVLLIIPILNVDGHERISAQNRPNQNGPHEMGWRTNSWNLNLNRDYLKAESPEIKAFLKLFHEWKPDFFIDNHTTNGADYQYHITYALEREGYIDKNLGEWGSRYFLPRMIAAVEQKGFLTAPYIQTKEDSIDSGIIDTPALPRLSTGYAALHNTIGLLVETHSLKPYENRVQSTLAMNIASLEILNAQYKALKKLKRRADEQARAIKMLPLKFNLKETSKHFAFKGFHSFQEQSIITGDEVIRYTNQPVEFEVPFYDSIAPANTVKLPKGYVIPKAFSWVTDLLRLHGVTVDNLKENKKIRIEEYKFEEVEFAQKPYEGRYCTVVRCSSRRRSELFPKGTYIVKTDQQTNKVIAHVLEPEAPDSLVSWGFFNAFFERKEYAEAYIMEPIAKQMLASDEQLQNEFLRKMEEETFRNDPGARLDFFYQRSPYFDIQEKKYPIFRII